MDASLRNIPDAQEENWPAAGTVELKETESREKEMMAGLHLDLISTPEKHQSSYGTQLVFVASLLRFKSECTHSEPG